MPRGEREDKRQAATGKMSQAQMVGQHPAATQRQAPRVPTFRRCHKENEHLSGRIMRKVALKASVSMRGFFRDEQRQNTPGVLAVVKQATV
eukprot:scaffold267413_cov31-Tisochrysis_lutea.AAC.3